MQIGIVLFAIPQLPAISRLINPISRYSKEGTPAQMIGLILWCHTKGLGNVRKTYHRAPVLLSSSLFVITQSLLGISQCLSIIKTNSLAAVKDEATQPWEQLRKSPITFYLHFLILLEFLSPSFFFLSLIVTTSPCVYVGERAP